jgi:hypothetical protein
VRDAAAAIRAVSEARDLCLGLRRSFAGPRVLTALRAGDWAGLSAEELRLGLGLAWAAGDADLVCRTLVALDADRLGSDPALLAFRDAVG